MFGTRNRRTEYDDTTRTDRGGFRNPFRRSDPDRVAGGFKAALANPNTTREGRREAKRSLRHMGRGNETHVPFMTKLRRTLGIRSTRGNNNRNQGLIPPTTRSRRRFGRRR